MSGMFTDYLTQTQTGLSMTMSNIGKVIPISLGTFVMSFFKDMVPTDDSTTSRILRSIVDSFKILFVVNVAK